MSRKEGRLLALCCQQAFIIRAKTEGIPLGIGRRSPSDTWGRREGGREGVRGVRE